MPYLANGWTLFGGFGGTWDAVAEACASTPADAQNSSSTLVSKMARYSKH